MIRRVSRFSIRLLAGSVLLADLCGARADTPPNLQILPGAAEIVGLAGARFSSTLNLSNPGTSPAAVTIGFIPFAGKATPAAVTRTLQPGESQKISAALSTLFGLNADAGALQVTSDVPIVAVLATLNVADPAGTYGVALRPVPEADLLSPGQTGHAIWVSQSADATTGYRTNVAVTLVDPNTSVDVRVYDGSGNLKAVTTVASASPVSWQARVVDLVGPGALDLGRVEFAVTAGRATGYTVVNDNVTSDAIAVQTELVGTGPADRLLDGAAMTAGLAGSFWSTDVRLFNPGAAPLDVQINALGFVQATSAVTRTIAPGAVVELSQVLDLFGLPSGVAGALRFRASAPLLIAARTNNIDPSGLRPGTFSAQEFVLTLPDDLIPAGSLGTFIGVEQTFDVPGVRTNLALFGGPNGASGSLVLSDAGGTLLATVPFSRAPFEWGQKNVADWFPALSASRSSDRTALAGVPDGSRIDIAVDSGDLDAYISRIDNGTNDSITETAQQVCGVGPFTIDPFTVSPASPATGTPAVFTWAFTTPGGAVSDQTLTESEVGAVSLTNTQRTVSLNLSQPDVHTATLTARLGCRKVTRQITYTVTCPTTPSITTATLPSGSFGSPYGPVTLAQTGGAAPLTWSATGLPSGLTLSSAGVLAGTPAASGTFLVALRVVDANGCFGKRNVTLTICPVIVILPTTLPGGTVGIHYGPVSLTASGGDAPYTFSVSAGSLPAGLSLASDGTISGTPANPTNATFSVQATDENGCTGTRSFSLVIVLPPSITSPDHLTLTAGSAAGLPFAVTTSGSPTPTISESGALPSGVTWNGVNQLVGAPAAGTGGTYPLVFTATNTAGTATQAFTLTVNQAPAITSGNSATFPIGVFGTFTVVATGFPPPTFTETGALPAGVTLNAATGVLSGTPGPNTAGSYPITITATNVAGSSPGQSFTLTVTCPVITVTNPGVTTDTANTAFSQTFAQAGGAVPVAFSLASGVLPAGLNLAANGTLSGTPLVIGTFPITVRATDANGCIGTGATYTLVISCQTLAISPTTVPSGTAGATYTPVPFASPNAIGTVSWTLQSGPLPTGMSFSTAGVLSGLPTQTGTFPITVQATDANGCTGTQALSLVINCQSFSVGPTALPQATTGVPYPSVTFTQTGGIGTVTFSQTGTLPFGMSFSVDTLSGTTDQAGSFPITVTATDSNGCTAHRDYLLVVLCSGTSITLSPSSLPTVVSGNAFPPTQFTASGGTGPYAFSKAGALPAGMTFAVDTLSGTPTQTGTFPITISATDSGGCTGSQDYVITVTCNGVTITVLPPTIPSVQAGTAFGPVTFTASGGAAGPYTFAEAGGLPTGMTFSVDTLSGTPTQSGTFPITITATDSNGCAGAMSYSLVVICQTITVTNPGVTTGTANSAFSQTFTQTGAIGGATFSTTSTLPAGLSLSTAGVLGGTPTQTGSFPIVVKVTDSNGCTGTSSYTLVISCSTVTVTNPAVATGTAGTSFSQTFTAAGTNGTVTFTLASGSLPTGLSLSSSGVLSGTPTQTGTFPITVTATDSPNGCSGTGATYTLVIACQTLTISPTTVPSGTAGTTYTPVPFASPNAIGTVNWTLQGGSLPTGMSFSTAGVLSGLPTQTGTFPITVQATDANGCTGTQSLSLVINCPTIGVLPASLAAGTAGVAYGPVTFTETNGVGTITWTLTGTLPTGVTFIPATATLSGTPTQTGSFPITVRATDQNGCFTDRLLTLVINCPTIGVLPASLAAGTAGVAYNPVTFTQTNGVGTITWTLTGALPTGMTFTAATATLSGTPTQTGSFSITVRATDQNLCFTDRPLTLVINCPTIVVGPFSLPMGTTGVDYGPVTFTQTGGVGSVSFSETGALPAGMSFTVDTLSGTTDQTGTFPITVTATDSNGCTGSRDYVLVIQCVSPTITITPNSLPSVVVGTAFTSTTFLASGGAAPYTFTQAGALPNGMSFSVNTLSGTPTVTGVFPITIAATDNTGCAGSRDYLLVVTCTSVTLAVSPGTLPAGLKNTAYGPVTLGASGGTGPYVFTEAGVLPLGMTFSAGALSGTPTQTGNFPVTVAVTDSTTGCTGLQNYTVTVNEPPTITSADHTIFPPGVSTTFTVTTTGFPTGAFMVISETGALPSGVTFVDNHDGTATISGTASGTGSFLILIKADNGIAPFATQNFTIALNSPPTITSADHTIFQTGQAGTFTVTTNGLPTPSLVKVGALPSVVSFTDNGNGTATIAGTPAAATGGTYPITITAANGILPDANQSFTLTVNQAPAITNLTTIFTVPPGIPMSSILVTTTGFPTGASMSLTEIGALPTGVTFTNNGNGTATVAGTPAAGSQGASPYAFTVTANNGVAPSANLGFTLNVVCPIITVSGSIPNLTYTTAMTTATFSQTNGNGPITWSATGLPGGVSINPSNGQVTGTPSATGTFNATITATDTGGCTGSKLVSFSVAPKLTPKAYTDVGNTQLAGGVAAPLTPYVSVVAVSNGDTSDAPINYAVTVGPSHGTLTAFNATGTFLYTPNAGNTASDAFTYTGTSSGVASTQTATIAFSGMVWYVNGAAGAGDGRSNTPFNSLAGASGAHSAGDFIFVESAGSPTSTPGAITLKANVTLWGQGTALPTIGGITIQNTGATTKPSLTNTVTIGGNTDTISSLDIASTTNTGLANTGTTTGTTVQNSVTVTTTTGRAILLSNAGGSFTFRSVTSNGATNGISLTNPSGTFTVTGDGATAGSGGTIQNTTGAGIELDNSAGATATLSLDFMTITAGGNENVHARTSSGTMNLSFSKCTVSNATAGASADGIHLEVGTTGNATLIADQSVFSLNKGDHISASLFGTGTLGVTITANTFTGDRGTTHGGTGLAQGVVVGSGTNPAFSAPNTFAGTVTYNISNNNFQGAVVDTIRASADGTGGSFNGTIANNTIGTPGTTDSGSAQGAGIALWESRAATHTASVTGNLIYQYNFAGIWIEGNSGNGTTNLTVKANTIANPGTFALTGLFADIGSLSGDTSKLCAVLGGSAPGDRNTLTGSGGAGNPDFWLMNEQNDVINLPGYGGGATNTAAVLAFVQGNNSPGATGEVDLLGAGSFTGSGTTCP
jgi:hypothetical protein